MIKTTSSILGVVFAFSLPFSANAGIFALGASKTTIDNFSVAETAQAVGRQGKYTVRDTAYGEVQVKFFGRWRKALNAQLLIEHPQTHNCDVEKLVEIIKNDNAVGLRLKAAITAPSSYLSKGLNTAKGRFPELETPNNEINKMIEVIKKHGSRDIHEGNIFFERSSETMWFEYSSAIDEEDIQSDLIEVESSNAFIDALMNIWLVEGQSKKSKLRISLKSCPKK